MRGGSSAHDMDEQDLGQPRAHFSFGLTEFPEHERGETAQGYRYYVPFVWSSRK